MEIALLVIHHFICHNEGSCPPCWGDDDPFYPAMPPCPFIRLGQSRSKDLAFDPILLNFVKLLEFSIYAISYHQGVARL